MTKPKFCKDCVWSRPEPGSSWILKCHNPKVTSKDHWALSDSKNNGSSCREERQLTWIQFPACGKAGKLFENY